MNKVHLRRAAWLIATLPVLSAGVAGTYQAHADTTIPDPPPCSPSSSANACEESMSRAEANETVWQSADLRLIEKHGGVKTIDLTEPGSGPGDLMIFDNLLMDESGGTVGRFLSRCLQVTSAVHQCEGSLLFADGTIQLSTTTLLGGEIIAAVTGGTGRYSGSNGQALIMPTSEVEHSAIAVDLATDNDAG